MGAKLPEYTVDWASPIQEHIREVIPSYILTRRIYKRAEESVYIDTARLGVKLGKCFEKKVR